MNATARTAVVVGVDGSDPALAAVRWAAVEAARRGAPLRLVAAVGTGARRPGRSGRRSARRRSGRSCADDGRLNTPRWRSSGSCGATPRRPP
ncbi:universal stress protein [Pseudonocardia lutea]|uniref:Universal stress protein n=1 Tax=Pseudonocardia lutea TaxID=2172015 RepID=A0ABW1IG23_9PSEU